MAQLSGEAARMAKGQKSLFFCQSRSTTEAVAEHMRRAGTTVFVHHSAVSREERALAEERFFQGSDACIVCTSTLELGIDVGDLDRVLKQSSGHRRCSAADGAPAVAMASRRARRSFARRRKVLQAIALVEHPKLDGWSPSRSSGVAGCADPPARLRRKRWHYGRGRVGPRSRVRTFGYSPGGFDRLVNWIFAMCLRLASGKLRSTEGRAALGARTSWSSSLFSQARRHIRFRRLVGRRSVAEQAFVDRLVDGVIFCWGSRMGRCAFSTTIDASSSAAPRGKQPTGRLLPQFLSYGICQRNLQTLRDEGSVPIDSLPPQSCGVPRRMRRFCGLSVTG